MLNNVHGTSLVEKGPKEPLRKKSYQSTPIWSKLLHSVNPRSQLDIQNYTLKKISTIALNQVVNQNHTTILSIPAVKSHKKPLKSKNFTRTKPSSNHINDQDQTHTADASPHRSLHSQNLRTAQPFHALCAQHRQGNLRSRAILDPDNSTPSVDCRESCAAAAATRAALKFETAAEASSAKKRRGFSGRPPLMRYNIQSSRSRATSRRGSRAGRG